MQFHRMCLQFCCSVALYAVHCNREKRPNFTNEMTINLFFHVLPALEHHTYSEDDVDEGGIKIRKKKKIFMKMAIF
jgi:hypothetical protein